MKISILHLSDLHFRENENSIFNKEVQFFNALKNNVNMSSYLFIVITGDIANTGQESEYKEFKRFIQKFEKDLRNYCANIKVEYILTPGNHDCDFSTPEQQVRDLIIETILKNPNSATIELVNSCAKVQDNYFKLVDSLHNLSTFKQDLSNKLLYRYEVPLNDETTISFNSYNFSFMSKRHEKQSELVLPINLINTKKILATKNDFRLNISLFHHPLHWLKHTSIREFTEFINESSDIVLSGHEHTPSGKETKDIYTQEYIEYIESGSLQDLHHQDNSKFNLINIELKRNYQEIITFYWEDDGYSSKIAEHNAVPNNNKTCFSLNSEYKDRISTLNIKLSHPRKDNILLDDLFVYPDLKSLNNDKIKEKSTYLELNAKELIHNKPKYIILYGADNSGKTSLARKFQVSYKKAGLIPIYIDGKDIKSNRFDVSNIKKHILKSFQNQYVTDDKQVIRNFEQSNMDGRVLLIDDFDSMHINNENKGLYIENLISMGYKNIILFADETLIFEATSESSLAKKLDDFEHYTILKFGYKLRDQLITKWIKLGQENEIDSKELILERKEKAEAIKNTIGLNLVPSRPLFILTLLQAMNMHEAHQLDKSSYGNYYHYLIMKNINSPEPMKPSDINTLFSYISLLAYEMFKKKQHSYSAHEINDFDTRYRASRKGFSPSFRILEKLVDSSILKTDDDNYSFTHKYLYYYFVAYHFSKNIDKFEYTDELQKMVKLIHRSESANILMFVLHFVPQDSVIQILLKEAINSFNDIEEFKFHNDEIKKINQLIESDTSHKLENRSIEENHDLEIEKQDKLEKHSLETNEESNFYNEEEDIELDFFNKLNHAIKLMEILGEITKNYAGTIDGDITYDIVKNTYGLGLRSLKNIIEMFEEHHNMLIDHLCEQISKKGMVNNANIKSTVSKSVFRLVSHISTDFIKKIAKAIGTKDLKQIYLDIAETEPNNRAYEIIKLAIDLNFNGGLNADKLIKLHKKLEHDKNLLTDSALKHLVLEHLYMYENDQSKKTSICTKLNIGVTSTRKALMDSKK